MKLNLSRFRLKVAALYGALIGQTLAAYFLDSRINRTPVVLGLTIVIMWTASQVGISEAVAGNASQRTHGRRYLQLRAHLDHFIADVKRLNWLAVDSSLGGRDREKTERDISETTERLVQRVSHIRESAGIARPFAGREPEGEPTPAAPAG